MTEPKTLDEIRDWFAARERWNKPGSSVVLRDGSTKVVNAWTRRVRNGHYDHNGYDENGNPKHPFLPTLDAAVSVMPTEYSWELKEGEWEAWNSATFTGCVYLKRTGNEIHDRYLLAYRACCAMDQAKENSQ